MILDEAMNNVSLVSSSPSKFPCSSSHIDVWTDGACNGSSWKWGNEIIGKFDNQLIFTYHKENIYINSNLPLD